MKKNEDISSKKELLETQINESRLKTAQALASIGNWELDLTTNELYWSDEIFNLFEIDQNKFGASYEAFLNAIHPDDRDLVNNAYLNSLKTKEKYTIQHRLLLKGEEVKYVEEKCESYFDNNGNPIKSLGTVQDITDLKLAELELEKKQKELEKNIAFLKSHQLAMNESSIVSKADLKGNIIYVNDNFCKVSGYSKEEVIGKPHNIIRHPNSNKETFKELWKTIKAKKVWKGILLNKGKVNDYWVDIAILPILDENDNIVEYIAVRHDITELINQRNEIERSSQTDTLTGLGNRFKLINDIRDSESTSLSLSLINIDNFREVNDFYGHRFGDFVIIEFANRLNDYFFGIKNKSLYRIQGDEFAVLNYIDDRDTFIGKMYSIVDEISSKDFVIQDEEISLQMTAVLSFEDDKNTLFTTADMSMKIAKRERKNILIYNKSLTLDKEYENNLNWTKKLKKAIKEDRLVAFYQPIVNNHTQKWEKYESLIRMIDEDGKVISPYFFLDIAKRTKSYIEITKIVITQSFETFKDSDAEFSINLTIQDILDDSLKEFLFQKLEEYKIGNRVVFEIVESEGIDNFDIVLEFIRGVKECGCQIAIDDFGTGYSNFEYLLQLKADYIKLDGSMIKNLDTNFESRAVVSTIVDFAKKMNMKTIAEFVKDENIESIVKEMGIDYSQGFYFSEPTETPKINK